MVASCAGSCGARRRVDLLNGFGRFKTPFLCQNLGLSCDARERFACVVFRFVKSLKGNRICEISPQLAEHLRLFLRTWRPNGLGLLFATKCGTPWDTDTTRNRKLYPILDKLQIPRCGFHAFRHGNETVMDQENVPMAVRQSRLGHSDMRTNMMYTHVASEDGKQFAAKLGQLLVPTNTTAVMSAGSA